MNRRRVLHANVVVRIPLHAIAQDVDQPLILWADALLAHCPHCRLEGVDRFHANPGAVVVLQGIQQRQANRVVLLEAAQGFERLQPHARRRVAVSFARSTTAVPLSPEPCRSESAALRSTPDAAQTSLPEAAEGTTLPGPAFARHRRELRRARCGTAPADGHGGPAFPRAAR